VRAEEMSFKEEGVYGVRKEIFLPWYNAYKFLIQSINRLENNTNTDFQFNQALSTDLTKLTNPTDRWITVRERKRDKYVYLRYFHSADPLIFIPNTLYLSAGSMFESN